jgi:hypothetical protein
VIRTVDYSVVLASITREIYLELPRRRDANARARTHGRAESARWSGSGKRAKERGGERKRVCHLSAPAIAGVVVAAAVPEAAGARAEVVDAVGLAGPLRQARPVAVPAAVPAQPHPPHGPCSAFHPVSYHANPGSRSARRTDARRSKRGNNYGMENSGREKRKREGVVLPSRPVSGSAPRPPSPSPPGAAAA